VRGIKMAVHLPMTAYLGVAIRMEPPAADATAGAITIVLEHRDTALSLELYRAADGSDIVAEWQLWGRVLGVPLLVAEAEANCVNLSSGWAPSNRRTDRAAAPFDAARATLDLSATAAGRHARHTGRAPHEHEITPAIDVR
jgi:hypothetical protein